MLRLKQGDCDDVFCSDCVSDDQRCVSAALLGVSSVITVKTDPLVIFTAEMDHMDFDFLLFLDKYTHTHTQGAVVAQVGKTLGC